MMTWRSVEGWEGYYDVSDNGLVRCCLRPVDRKWGAVNWTGGTLTPRLHSQGYLRVNLSRDGIAVDAYIHRLVAKAFIRNEEDLPYVNHINGNKKDNKVENLEWVSPSQNCEHAYVTGLSKRIKLKVFDRDGEVLYDGITVSELVKLGYQQPAISRCLSGRLGSHKSCKFEIIKEIDYETSCQQQQ